MIKQSSQSFSLVRIAICKLQGLFHAQHDVVIRADAKTSLEEHSRILLLVAD